MRLWVAHQCNKRLKLDLDFDEEFDFVESADADRRRCRTTGGQWRCRFLVDDDAPRFAIEWDSSLGDMGAHAHRFR